MKFPNLTVQSKELLVHKRIEKKLITQLKKLFYERYHSTKPKIKCSGSTNKGTVLPSGYFDVDYDVTVKADDALIERIAYKSDTFEGCQLFSMEFFTNFTDFFDEVYFAGHRLSGKLNGKNFDFSISDQKKDKWKWDYNSSKFLHFNSKQIEDIKKLKYFLKKFNVYGSDVNGIVGPAIELAIYYNNSFEKVIKITEQFQKLQENNSFEGFRTVVFPDKFFDLFAKREDYIHKGLIESFRYTCSNTFNRLVEIVNQKTLSVNKFLSEHSPKFNYKKKFKNKNIKVITHALSVFSKTSNLREKVDHIDILKPKDKYVIYAHLNDENSISDLESICNQIDALSSEKELDISTLGPEFKKDIYNKLREEDFLNYCFFIGKPNLPLRKGVFYIPFDFLVREDAPKLIRIMKEGQK